MLENIPAIYQTVIGITAGTLTASAMLPQLIKILREKKAEDISIVMLFVLSSGLAIWVFYGCIKKDIALIITNSFSLLINILVTIFSFIYKRK